VNNFGGRAPIENKNAFFAVVSAIAQYIERADNHTEKSVSPAITRKDDEEHGS
jgi:hypothetical protein